LQLVDSSRGQSVESTREPDQAANRPVILTESLRSLNRSFAKPLWGARTNDDHRG
jgi:hypothetical protein